jgi:hypothetical protein
MGDGRIPGQTRDQLKLRPQFQVRLSTLAVEGAGVRTNGAVDQELGRSG